MSGGDVPSGAMATPRQIADFVIRLSDPTNGDVMTHLRLQKLVYYCQAWSLAIRDKPLFPDKFQAWPHGPVCPNLWSSFKQYGFGEIPPSAAKSDFSSALSEDEIEFLSEVWRVYGGYTAKRLEDMTHSEAPWKAARGDLAPHVKSEEEITQESMKHFYQLKRAKRRKV